MPTTLSQAVFRKDYTQPDYLVEQVELGFDLDPEETRVANRMTLARRAGSKARDILLFGNGLKLAQLRMNGVTLRKHD